VVNAYGVEAGPYLSASSVRYYRKPLYTGKSTYFTVSEIQRNILAKNRNFFIPVILQNPRKKTVADIFPFSQSCFYNRARSLSGDVDIGSVKCLLFAHRSSPSVTDYIQ